MLKLHDTIMYGTTGVCTVESIENKKIGKVQRKYYVLKPKAQATSTVFLPADNTQLLSKVRCVITVEEINGMLKSLHEEPSIWIDDDNERKARFGEIVTSGDRKACLVMLKTLVDRQKELSEKGKRLHLADERVMREAQRLINDEFGYVLGMGVEDVKALIFERINVK